MSKNNITKIMYEDEEDEIETMNIYQQNINSKTHNKNNSIGSSSNLLNLHPMSINKNKNKDEEEDHSVKTTKKNEIPNSKNPTANFGPAKKTNEKHLNSNYNDEIYLGRKERESAKARNGKHSATGKPTRDVKELNKE
jgi:hypothetical protein